MRRLAVNTAARRTWWSRVVSATPHGNSIHFVTMNRFHETNNGRPGAIRRVIHSVFAFVGKFVVSIPRNLPTIGGALGVVAVGLSIIGSVRDSGHDGVQWTWDHWIHRIGEVVTLNAGYESRHDQFTHMAQACAVLAAGILALEIFRFLAGSAYNKMRRALRRLGSKVLDQRRIMVIGSMPEAYWMAERIARQTDSARMWPRYVVSHVRVNSDERTDRAAPLGALMSIDVPHLDATTLQDAGLGHSDEVLLFGAGDARALELLAASMSVDDVRTGRRAKHPRVLRVRLESPDTVELVRQAEWSSPGDRDAGKPSVDVRVLSADDIAARQMLRVQRIDWRHSFGKPGGSTELICLGFGDSQRAFALAMLRRVHHVDEARMSIVAIDLEVVQAVARLRSSFPHIDDVADIRCIAADAFSVEARQAVADSAARANVNLCIAVSVGDVDRNLELALGLPKAVRSSQPGAPSPIVFVRQSLIADVSSILQRFALIGRDGLMQLHPWGGLHDSYDPSVVLEGALDARAKRVHEAYLSKYPPRPEDANDRRSSRRPWDQLAQFKREDNRNSADFFDTRLGAIGLRVAGPEECRSLPNEAFVDPASISAAEREIMSRLEHRRWVVMRLLSGWTHGSKKDEVARTHPSICPWADLSEEERKKDDMVAAIEVALLPEERVVRVNC